MSFIDRVFNASCENMAEVPNGVVHTCVTSPPYYGLRDYGIDGQLGLERTVADYVARMVSVFREVKRVLRDDGTLWLNIGDSYAAAYACNRGGRNALGQGAPSLDQRMNRLSGDLKEKDLMGVPWALAFALRADGWYLRAENIWHKPNPMPESVVDRTTRAHEHLFMFSKSPKYYYDQDAIREPLAESSVQRLSQDVEHQLGSDRANAGAKTNGSMKAVGSLVGGNKKSVWTVPTAAYADAHFATFPLDLIRPCIMAGSPSGGLVLDPFMGSGTTARVAIEHGRHFVGYELNPEYHKLIQDRLGLFGAA